MADTKISALAAGGVVAGSEMLPIVQGGATKRVSALSLLQDRRGFPRVFNYYVIGDSKAGTYLTGSGNGWLDIAHQIWPIEHSIVGSTVCSGKTIKATGDGVAIDSNLAAMIAAGQANGGAANVLVFQGFTNQDGATFAAQMSAWQKIVEKARAAGYRLIITLGVDPSSTTGNAGIHAAIDASLAGYARNNPDVWYVPASGRMIDPTSAVRAQITSPRLPMGDGIHDSAFGSFLKGKVYADFLQARGVPRIRFDYPSAADFACTANQDGNIFGPGGSFQGSNDNSAAVSLSGGGGVTGATAWQGTNAGNNYLRLSGTLTGSAAVAISRTNAGRINDEFGRTNELYCTRLTFSGTTGTSPSSIIISAAKNIFQTGDGSIYGTGVLRAGLLWGANTMVGLQAMASAGDASSTDANAQLPTLSGIFLAGGRGVAYVDASDTGGYGFYEDLRAYGFYLAPSTAVSGSIDFYEFVSRLDRINPTAAA